ncbi:retrovirus-related Pol polyprotein from transposon opus [Trichonephila clavata]|uniref:Retrovirus-related Pol polyprotein from transposon opus n=1 Tax=Trichonephila clavata TaxID=2740835 RepID=A0A8X6I1Q1_TRICU|nr:retrovirus-related Pol polyprotein from transposon opus [Trichonephila clavata]
MRLIASNVVKFMRRRNVWHTIQNAEIVMEEVTGQKCAERTLRNKQKNVAARRVNVIEENCENSETIYIGELKRIVKIKLKEKSAPHVAVPRKVPLSIHNKVKEELKNMVEAGIISKVEEPTEWVSNMVLIDSHKKLRIYFDHRPLNEVIQRPHYPIPTADALVTKLQGSKVFIILDAKNGLGQLPLDEESLYLTTFCTPWGWYRFLVLPFGLNSAPEEFQKSMDEIYEEDEDINPYFDDIALGSFTVEEHCRLLRRTLLQAKKANLKFNELKTQLSQTSVNYLGYVLSDEGIKSDLRKIRAIEEFATPNCKEDLQRFLG